MLLIGLVIGYFLGMFVMSKFTAKYFEKNPDVIEWKGKIYVRFDKSDTNDNCADTPL